MPVKDDIGRDQSKEFKAENRQEQEAAAAGARGVYRDFESQEAGVGAGLVGYNAHLNGGVSDASRGAVRDSARDDAAEKHTSRSPAEKDLVDLQTRKGVDASYTNPTMQKDAVESQDIGRQVEFERYDQVRQQGGVGTPDQQPIPSAKGQPAMERVVGGLDAATQESFAGIVQTLGNVMKGGQSQQATGSKEMTKGRDAGDNSRSADGGPSMFGNGGKGTVAPVTPGQKEFTAAKRERESVMATAGR